MKMSVIGTGYLGAVHAACMAQIGHEVVAYDTDASKIATLSTGRSPFFEPGFDELLAEVLATGRLRFTQSAEEAVSGASVHFVCVGTPSRRARMRPTFNTWTVRFGLLPPMPTAMA